MSLRTQDQTLAPGMGLVGQQTAAAVANGHYIPYPSCLKRLSAPVFEMAVGRNAIRPTVTSFGECTR